jgi:DNA-binding SARP family transcriptional activator
MGSGVRLELLGGFALQSAAGEPILLSARKPRALLAYLALAGARPQPRERLAALLWPDSSEQQARTSLRQALTAVRRAVEPAGGELIVADSEQVALEFANLELDVAQFEQAATSRSVDGWQQAVQLYRGHLLDGFSAEAPTFEQWCAAERERLRAIAINALAELLTHQEERGTHERALETATRLLSLDPVREETQRALMRLYLRKGRVVDAIKQYQACRQVLARELGVQPAPETERLYREILNQRRAARPAEPLPAEGAATAPAAPAARRDLRHGVTLFVDLHGFTAFSGEHDPEITHDYLLRYRALVRGLVEEHGGRLTNYIGARVMAVFGVPTAHENDAARACAAAVVLRDHVPLVKADAGHSFWPQIGLASGRLFADVEGDSLVVSGEPVSLAARVMERAPAGQIYLTEGVRQALGGLGDVVDLPDVHIQAAAQPLHVWQLDRMAPPAGRRAPLVGRRLELAQARSLLEACGAKRSGQVLAIRGEAGIGKSRLLEEIALEATARGFECHRALVLDFGAGSGGAVAALVRSLLGVGEGGDQAAARGIDTAAREGRIDVEVLPHLYDLLGLPLPEELRESHSELDATSLRRAQQGALADLVRWAAQRAPLLVAVEDVHWADAATLDALARVAAAARQLPVLLVLTTRGERDPLGAAWRAASGHCPLTTLDLSPLSDDEAREFAARYECEDEVLVRSCVARADGNPLFLDQLLRNARAGSSALPGSLQSIVVARLDRLQPAEREALQAASVLGQQFSLEAVASLAPIQCSCDDMVAQGLVRPEGEGYIFSHVLIQEAVYASMVRAHRQTLHKRAGQWFAMRDPLLAAEHLDAAQDPGAATAYLTAARAEAERHRYDRALRLVERGLALNPDLRVRQALICARGDVLRDIGEPGAAVQAFREALNLAQADEEKSHALIGLASALRILDQTREALTCAESALDHARARGDPAELAQIHLLLGNLYFPLGQIDACLEADERALGYAQQAGDPVLEARALGSLGDAYFLRAQIRTSGEYVERCIALCKAHRLTWVEAAMQPMLGAAHFYQNRPQPALEACERGIELARRVGSLRAELLSRDIASAVYYYMGDLGRAIDQARQTIDLCERLGARRFEAEAMGILGMALFAQGERERAEAVVDRAWTVCEGVGESYVGPWVLGAQARVTLDPAKRRDALARAEALLAQGCVSHAYFHFYDLAIETSLDQGEWSEALRYAQALERYTSVEAVPWCDLVVRCGRVLAQYGAGERGNIVRDELAAVAQSAREVGYRSFEARIDALSR